MESFDSLSVSLCLSVSLSLSLSIHPSLHPLFPAGPLTGIQCPNRADEYKLLMVGQYKRVPVNVSKEFVPASSEMFSSSYLDGL